MLKSENVPLFGEQSSLLLSTPPDIASLLGTLVVEEEVDFMDPLMVGPPQPQGQLGGLARLQCAALQGNLCHTGRPLSKVLC